MKYKCLVLDHDDTTVDSSSTIHYPAHLEVMKRLRPNEHNISLETWYEKNFDPGIIPFLTEELQFSEAEMEEEFQIWQEMNEDRNPPFYPGLTDILKEYIGRGGLIAVVSHSTEEHIRRHYAINADGLKPEYIFGWEHNPAHRKPSPWPLEQIMEGGGFQADELLVVDDLKPGVQMAKAAGVKVAAAGWGHSIPSIRNAMNDLCDFFLPSVESLKHHILE